MERGISRTHEAVSFYFGFPLLRYRPTEVILTSIRTFSPHALPQPPPPQRLWDVSKPIDLELGCGAGWFAIRSALSHPEREFIAVEHAQLRFSKFEGRYERNGRPKNLFPIRAHAVYWVHHYLPEESVDRIFLLYPNPYPKAAQKNKRWHEMPFFPALLARLKVGGQITLATNEIFYAQGFEGACLASGLERVEKCSLRKGSVPDWAPRTHFEKKFLDMGVECFHQVFEKKAPLRAEPFKI